mgnify:CR=1 FL=1
MGSPVSSEPATDNAALVAVLRELLASGVEQDDPRIGYVTMQVDRPTLAEARRVLADAGTLASLTPEDLAGIIEHAHLGPSEEGMRRYIERMVAAGRTYAGGPPTVGT